MDGMLCDRCGLPATHFHEDYGNVCASCAAHWSRSMDPLVRQKNDLLALIHCGELALATTVLDFLAPSWAASNYGYKATELRALIGQALVRREYRGASA